MSGWIPTSRTDWAQAERLHLLAGGVGMFLLYVLGFEYRGTAPDVLGLYEAGREVVGSLPSAASSTTLATPHPLAELLFGLAGSGSGSFVATFEWAAPLLVVASLPAVWQLASRLTDSTGALLATALFAVAPATVASATTADVSCLFVFVWTWSLALTLRADVGALATPLLWGLAAAAVLVWPPFLLWGAILLVLHISATASDAEPGPDGTWRRATVPGAILAAPLAVPALVLLLHPGFWGHPIPGWARFLEFAMTWTPDHWPIYEPARPGARPSLSLGFELAARQYPVVLSATSLFGFGALWWNGDREGRDRAIARRGVLVGLPLALLLPWLHRGPAYGRIEFSLVALPFVASLAGVGLERMARAVRRASPPSLSDAAFLTLPVVALVSVASTTAIVHPWEGSRRTPVFGGVESAVADGHRLSRDDVLPVSTFRKAASTVDGQLHAAGAQSVTEAYAAAGYLPADTPADAVEADGFLRFLEAGRPATEASRSSGRSMVDVDESTRVVARVGGIPVAILE